MRIKNCNLYDNRAYDTINYIYLQTLSLENVGGDLSIVVLDASAIHLLDHSMIPLMDVWIQYLVVPISKYS